MTVVTPRDSQAIRDLVHVVRPARIIEFGSWQGRSALSFLIEASKFNPLTKITCVDTWLGSAEHWDPHNTDVEWGHQNLLLEDGEPQFFSTFKAAIESNGFSERVDIVRAPTSFAGSYLVANYPDADLIFIDADHSAGAVKADISIARQLSSEGLIAGDDWCWPSVKFGAVAESLLTRDRILRAPDDFGWALVRPGQEDLSQGLLKRGWRRTSKFRVLVFLALHKVKGFVSR